MFEKSWIVDWMAKFKFMRGSLDFLFANLSRTATGLFHPLTQFQIMTGAALLRSQCMKLMMLRTNVLSNTFMPCLGANMIWHSRICKSPCLRQVHVDNHGANLIKITYV